MHILFIYPNLHAQIGFNYGVAILSGILKQDGHTTSLLNINEQLGYPFDLGRIMDDIAKCKPDVIAFSLVTPQFQYAEKIASEIRKHYTIPIICGGIHATVATDEVMATGLFDVVFVGEADYAIREYMRVLEHGGDLEAVPNICFRKNGSIVKNRVMPFVPLETLPPKDYDIFDFQKMIDAKNGWVGLMASRGCPFRCTYCFNHQIVERYSKDLGVPAAQLGYIRHHPLRDLLEEIRFLLSRYRNIKMFIFDDDLFTFNRDYVLEFCKEYPRLSNIPFVVNAHVQVFDATVAQSLKKANCRIVKFGLESGSERVRRVVMKRMMKNDTIRRALSIAEDAGLHSSVFVMVGLPTETRDEVLETIQLIADTKPGRFRWTAFYPFPGTVAWEMSKKMGFIDEKKMSSLSNFTDDSCLDFGSEHNLWLAKVLKIFPWYVNARSGFACASTYQHLVRDVEAMNEQQWSKASALIRARDAAHARTAEAAGQLHYAIRYNPFMAVRSDWNDEM
ncbi:MAG: B12-binding domain-containing radical SAM protein [Desulfobacterota bacterium]|nr:B12-binding domain-containing radical SAM protein [Thermodesulfobacteriota bacterium]